MKAKTPPKPDWMGPEAVFVDDVGWMWTDPNHVPLEQQKTIRQLLEELLELHK